MTPVSRSPKWHVVVLPGLSVVIMLAGCSATPSPLGQHTLDEIRQLTGDIHCRVSTLVEHQKTLIERQDDLEARVNESLKTLRETQKNLEAAIENARKANETAVDNAKKMVVGKLNDLEKKITELNMAVMKWTPAPNTQPPPPPEAAKVEADKARHNIAVGFTLLAAFVILTAIVIFIVQWFRVLLSPAVSRRNRIDTAGHDVRVPGFVVVAAVLVLSRWTTSPTVLWETMLSWPMFKGLTREAWQGELLWETMRSPWVLTMCGLVILLLWAVGRIVAWWWPAAAGPVTGDTKVLPLLLNEVSEEIRARRQPEYLYTAAAIAGFGAVAWGVAAVAGTEAARERPCVAASLGIALVAVSLVYKFLAEHNAYMKQRKSLVDIFAVLNSLTGGPAIPNSGVPEGFQNPKAGWGFLWSIVVVVMAAGSAIWFCESLL